MFRNNKSLIARLSMGAVLAAALLTPAGPAGAEGKRTFSPEARTKAAVRADMRQRFGNRALKVVPTIDHSSPNGLTKLTAHSFYPKGTVSRLKRGLHWLRPSSTRQYWVSVEKQGGSDKAVILDSQPNNIIMRTLATPGVRRAINDITSSRGVQKGAVLAGVSQLIKIAGVAAAPETGGLSAAALYLPEAVALVMGKNGVARRDQARGEAAAMTATWAVKHKGANSGKLPTNSAMWNHYKWALGQVGDGHYADANPGRVDNAFRQVNRHLDQNR